MSANPVSLSIVIPYYNEKEGMQILLDTLEEFHKKSSFSFEVVLVDDGSIDGTMDIIKNHGAFPFGCKLVSLSANFGAHAATRAGFVNATGKFTTCLPADLQISLETVEKLYAAALEGYDIVYGVREVNEVALSEKIFSSIYARAMRSYVNRDFPFKGLETLMIESRVREVLNNNIESNSSLILQTMSMGFKNRFVDIKRTNRNFGKSKWTLSKKVKLLIDSFVAFSFAPIRMVSIAGILFFIIGLAWTSYLIIRKLLFDDLASGWPALLSILLLGFGITNISLGIVAEYLWRTLDASRRRPVFIIDKIIQLDRN